MAFLSLDKRRERKEHVTVVVLSLANCYFSYDDADRFAAILNERGMSSGEGKSFTVRIVARIKRNYSLTPRYDRLRKAGMLTVEEMAALLGIRPQSVKIWKQHGLVRGHAYNDKNAEQISANISVRWEPDGILGTTRSGLAHSPLARHFIAGLRSLSQSISHFRKLLIRVTFARATHAITAASSMNPSTGMESGMRSNGLTK